jgi:hypothetical protein
MTPECRAILDTLARASDAQRRAGADWYPTAGRIVAEIAAWSGCDVGAVAAALAALSPRNPWRWNVADVAACAHAVANGRPAPRVTTFGANRETALAFLAGSADWRGSARKVRAFVRAILGDPEAVVVDVWAVRVATAGAREAVASVTDYDALAAAYHEASDACGIAPRDLQAITWLVAREAGGVPDARKVTTCKRGTLPIVRELLDGQLALAL